MANYLIQDTTLISIADEVRTLSGTEETLSPEVMKEKISVANEEIAAEADLIAQIITALEGKNSGNNVDLPYITGIVTVNTSTTFTIPELVGYDQVMLYPAPAITSYVITGGSQQYPKGFYYDSYNGCLCIWMSMGGIGSNMDWTYDSTTGTFTGESTYGQEESFIYVAYKG